MGMASHQTKTDTFNISSTLTNDQKYQRDITKKVILLHLECACSILIK